MPQQKQIFWPYSNKNGELQAMHIGKLFLVVNNQFSLSKIKYANLNNISECKN